MFRVPPSCRARVAVLVVPLLVSACDAKVSVDLTDGPIDSAREVVLGITGVVLLDDANRKVSLDLGGTEMIDLLAYRDGKRRRLVGEREVANGRYVGVALQFADDVSYVTHTGGAKVAIETPAVLEFAETDLSIGEDDAETILLDLNLRFSLIQNSAGTYTLAPALRAVEPEKTGNAGGAVATAILEADACRNGRETAHGVAVYAFRGHNAVPADYTGQANLVDAARIAFDIDSGAYRYALHFLPAGPYTLALTCHADADRPNASDSIAFKARANVTIEAAATATANFL